MVRNLDSRSVYSFKNNKVFKTYANSSGSIVTKTLSTDMGSNFELCQSSFSNGNDLECKEANTESFIPSVENTEPLLSIAYDSETQLVTISCNADRGVVKYTTNGREVSEKSKIYREPFEVRGNSVIKAKCFDSDKNLVDSSEFEVILTN